MRLLSGRRQAGLYGGIAALDRNLGIENALSTCSPTERGCTRSDLSVLSEFQCILNVRAKGT